MKIATSLSAALKEIVSGAIKAYEVNAVICGTNYPTVERAIASECLMVDKRHRPATVIALKALWPRVIQPRQLGSHAPRANPKTFFEADSIGYCPNFNLPVRKTTDFSVSRRRNVAGVRGRVGAHRSGSCLQKKSAGFSEQLPRLLRLFLHPFNLGGGK